MGKKRPNSEAPIVKKIEEPMPDNLETEIVEKTEELVKEAAKEVEAIVDGVEMALNIRKEPEVKPNNQIAVLKKGTKIIVVDPEKPVKSKGDEWYRIKIVDKDKPTSGYAMKKYIKII